MPAAGRCRSNRIPSLAFYEANEDYAHIEERTKAGEPIEAVLVSAGPIDALRKAYPNYFLDTAEFVAQIGKVIEAVGGSRRRRTDSER